MKKLTYEDDKYIYVEQETPSEEYVEVQKKKKRRRGLKIFLGIFIPIILMPFLLIAIVAIMLYKNYDNPTEITAAETLNLKQSAINSLDQFFEKEGNEEYKISISEQTLNKTIYSEFYLKQNANFLLTPENKYFKTIGDKNSSLFLGLKGAWLKIEKDTITIYMGADLIKPISFKTGISISFKIKDCSSETENYYELKLDYLRIGKTKISQKNIKKLLNYAKKNEAVKTQIESLFATGYPAENPIITLNEADLSAKVDKVKLFNLVEEKAKGHYDESKQEQVKQLFNHYRKKFLSGDIFVLNFDNSSFNFELKANKLKAKEEFVDISDKYASGTRLIDLVKNHQQDILLNINNISIPTGFTINIDTAKLPKLFRFFADQNGYFANPLFKKGKKLTIESLNKSYGFRLEPINMKNYSKEQLTIEAYAYIFPINEDNSFGKELRTNVELGVKPTIDGDDLKLVITEFKWGQTETLNNDALQGLMAFIKQKGVEDDAIVLKDVFKKFKLQSGFDCREIIFHEDQISLKIDVNDVIADHIKTVKQKVCNVLQQLKITYPEASSNIDKLVEIVNGAEHLDFTAFESFTQAEKDKLINRDQTLRNEKIAAINQISQLLSDSNKYEQFKKDLFTQTIAGLDQETMTVLNFG